MGGEIVDREAVRLGQGFAANAHLIFKGDAFAKLGVLAGPDMEIIEKVIPADPLDFKFGLEKQYQQLKDDIRFRLNTQMKYIGLTPETGIGTDVSKSNIREQTKSSQDTYGG